MAELTKRYIVMSMATEAPFDLTDPDGAFVLKPWKDPAALRALVVYSENCYPELGRDLEAWVRAIQSGPALRGDVGRRNEPHLRPAMTTPEIADDARSGRRPRRRRAAKARSATRRGRQTRKAKRRGRQPKNAKRRRS
jgi:hypothetical protein